MIKKFNVNEYSSWILGRGSPHNCLIVVGVDGDIQLETLEKSVAIVSEKNEMLRYSISLDTCGFIAIEKKIPIRVMSLVENWQSIGEAELDSPFLDGEVLARITVLRTRERQYLLLCFHHIIGDGASGMQFLLDIIDTYNGRNINNVRDISKEGLPLFPGIKSPDGVPPKNGVKTKISSLIVEGSEVKDLLKSAKEAKCSLNAFLSAKILKAMNEVFDVSEVQVCFSINLRKCRGFIDENQLKFLTSWINFEVVGFDEEIAPLCSILQKEIKNKLRNNQHLENLNDLLRLINNRKNDESYAQSFISKNATICISNSGNLEVEHKNVTENGLKINEIHLSVNAQSYMGTRDSFTVQITMLNSQSIFININYPSPLISELKINQYLVSLRDKITCKELSYCL